MPPVMSRAIRCKTVKRSQRLLIPVIAAGLLFFRCGDLDSDSRNEVLIRVGGQVLTVLDFNNALEFSKTAYPHNSMQTKDVKKSIRLRLFNQLIEEMILLEKAKTLGISVSDAEIEKKINDIKSDYPDEEFEKAFLENAISFDIWKERMKRRLVIEKIIASELEDKIRITQEDIAHYYAEHYQGRDTATEPLDESEPTNQIMIKSIRRKKAEEAYQAWIGDLKKEADIDINKGLWEKLANP